MNHKEYLQRLFELEIDADPVEPYINMNTKIAHECINGHIWKVKPSHLVHSKSGCPHCSGMARKTTAQHRIEVAPIIFLGEYKNARSKLTYECIKGHAWESTPHTILNVRKSGANGCPRCSKNYSPNTEEYSLKLKPSIICIDEYINSIIPILHECTECSIQWKASPGNVLQGTGCPECGGRKQKTHEEYCAELDKYGIIPLDIYSNNKKSLLHKCTEKGHQIYTTPVNMLFKMLGCPFCRKGSPYKLYFIEFIYNNEKYYKVGITSKSAVDRVSSMRPKSGIIVTVLLEIDFDTFGLAIYEEQRLLKKYSEYRTRVSFVDNGNTEFFTENILLREPCYNINIV